VKLILEYTEITTSTLVVIETLFITAAGEAANISLSLHSADVDV
jgi:hypothetical protein